MKYRIIIKKNKYFQRIIVQKRVRFLFLAWWIDMYPFEELEGAKRWIDKQLEPITKEIINYP